ncbi:hypothetical protein DL770_010653 [Monosporascus sp. CRB-9-2]|nr:hypothetical protein DL770_010653 [Monosporascus sp. CRB-9-2]
MEPVSLTTGLVGLAGLLSSGREAKGMYDSYRRADFETQGYQLQRDATAIILQRWMERTGYNHGDLEKPRHESLDDPKTRNLIENIVQYLRDVNPDARVKPVEVSSSGVARSREPGARGPSKGSVNLDKYREPMSRKAKAKWAWQDKAQASEDAQKATALLQILNELIPLAASHGAETAYANPGDDPEPTLMRSLLEQTRDLLVEFQVSEERRKKDEFRKDLSRWLGSTWTSESFQNFVHARVEHTCTWIFQRPEFQSWESPGSARAKVLWVRGPAGYGKTILCAKVIEHLQEGTSPLAYYFFSSESESRADPFAIVRAWIYQLINQDPRAFDTAWIHWEASDRLPMSTNDSKKLFESILQTISSCILIVDGLDECAGTGYDGKTTYRESLTGFLSYLKRVTSDTSRIAIFSRDEPELRDGLRVAEPVAHWDLFDCIIQSSDVEKDALRFARNIVDQGLRKKSEARRDELSHRIVDRFESMFLGIRIVGPQLASWKSPNELDRTIDQAPTRLNDLYDRNWKGISELPEPERSRALEILRWATFSLRPLTVLELTEALLLVNQECSTLSEDDQPDEIDEEYIERGILKLCGSLVETRGTGQDPARWTVHLTHFSVKQYILSHELCPAGQVLANEQLRAANEAFQNNVLAVTCLRYLILQVNATSWERNAMIHVFRNYAVTSWHQHVRRETDNARQAMKWVNDFFGQGDRNWESWRQEADRMLRDDMLQYDGSVQTGSRLFYASLLGFQETVAWLIEDNGMDVNEVDSSTRTAVLAAASTGWMYGIKYLLEQEARIDIASNQGRTPLYVAAANGHLDVVKLLLDKGADLMVANYNGWTPLNSASDSGHLELQIVATSR